METQFKERALEYLGGAETLIEKLGSAQEGFVYRTSRKTALKVFERERNFNAELKAYQILQALNVEQFEGQTKRLASIPQNPRNAANRVLPRRSGSPVTVQVNLR